LKTVGLGGANAVRLTTNERVDGANEDIVLKGRSPTDGSVTNYSFNAASFTSQAGTTGNQWESTWVATQAFATGQMHLRLLSAATNVIDVAGNRLAGTWDNPINLADATSGTFPSGNSVAGVDFSFSFTILNGDADQNNVINILDLNIVRNNFSASPATWAQGDFNGNNTVDIADLNAVRNDFGLAITTAWDGSEALMMMGGGGGGQQLATGEQRLRQALRDYYYARLQGTEKDDGFEGLLHWNLLGDEEWWKVTLSE
jgi:hypothetical protein